jgi:hypothetical protein
MKKPKVAVLKTSAESVLQDIDRLFELAEIDRALDRERATILKDNISWHLFFPGANSTPWQIEGTILGLRKRGFRNIAAVENNTVVTNTIKGEKENKFDVVYKKHEIPVKFNYNPEHMRWVLYQPKKRMRILHKIYKDGIHLPDFFFGKNIVHLPTVKTHIYTTFTCSMKNAFGGLLNTKRHYTHSHIHETLVDLLAIQKEIHAGIFGFADGTTFGNGPGPRTMMPVVKNLILASADCVALDAVAAKLMGFDPMSIGFIRMAHEDELGVGRPEEIEIVGVDIEPHITHFEVGDNMASRVGDLFWFSPLKIFQNLMFRTPLVYSFVFGSYIYHDYVWYPYQGKQRVDSWRKTEWGRLFDSY